jgi:hypothetical protein
MKKMVSAAAILAVVTVSSSAGVRYDEKLEKAAMAIVAEKIGDIRGGFSYAQKLQLVVRQGEARRVVKEARKEVSADGTEGRSPPGGGASSITNF